MKSVDLVPLSLPPGLYKNGSVYQSKGRWYDAQLMRFFTGTIRPIGGWQRMQDATNSANLVQLAGVPRTTFAYRPNQSSPTDDGPPYMIFCTNDRVYVVVGKTLFDISPLNPIPATNVAPWPTAGIAVTGHLETSGSSPSGNTTATLIGSTTLTGTFNVGDTLVFGSTNIMATGLDIVSVTAQVTAAANSAVVTFTPALATTWANNTNVVYIAGANRDSGSTGYPAPFTYGYGNYGLGPYGSGAGSATFTNATTWQVDAFGQDSVLVSTYDGHLYYWPHNSATVVSPPTWGLTTTGTVQTSGATPANSPTIAITATTMTGTILHGQQFTISGVVYTALLDATAAANIATVTVQPLAPAGGIAGATALSAFTEQSPLANRGVVVTPERYIMLLGAGGDARTVQWADRESSTQWGPIATNTAGSFKLKTNGALMAGRHTRNQTLLWTDSDVWAATWIGGNYVYRFDLAGDHCGLIAPNAIAITDTQAYWLGINGFFVFDGYVRSLPCEVQDFVFNRLNTSQKAKIWAMPVAQYGEIWFFYPSGSEVDSYVIYNYRENHWSTGTLARASGDGSDSYIYPIMCSPTGLIYEHENGQARDGVAAYVESGPVELGNGNDVMSINRMVMDENTLGSVNLSFTAAYYPGEAAAGSGYAAAIPFTVPNFTTAPVNCRITGRQARIRFTESAPSSPTSFRIGNMRMGMVKQGTR